MCFRENICGFGEHHDDKPVRCCWLFKSILGDETNHVVTPEWRTDSMFPSAKHPITGRRSMSGSQCMRLDKHHGAIGRGHRRLARACERVLVCACAFAGPNMPLCVADCDIIKGHCGRCSRGSFEAPPPSSIHKHWTTNILDKSETMKSC